MRRDELEDRVHDFLDGRLSDVERAAFERRLADDPDLASRVESYRALREALRRSPAEIPPGFYARARARFEAERRRRMWWRRPATWEVAGLAAAGLLVAALVVPGWMRNGQGPSGIPDSPLPAGDREISGDREVGRGDVALRDEHAVPARELEREKEPAAGDRPAPAEHEVPKKAAPRAAAAPAAGADREEASVSEGGPPPVPGQAPATSIGPPPKLKRTRPEAEEDNAREAGFAQAPDELAHREVRAAPTRDEPRRQEASEKDEAVSDLRRVSGLAEASPESERRLLVRPMPPEVASSLPLQVESLPEGALEARALRFVSEPEEWRRLREGLGLAAGLAPDFDAEQVLLIGPREAPLDCGSIRWRTMDGLVEVRVSFAPDAVPTGGCAVVLPAGARSVGLVVREAPGE